MSYEIREVNALPPELKRGVKGKYAEIWEKCANLQEGQWIEVQCGSAKDAENLRFSARMKKNPALMTRIRGNSVYIAKRPVNPVGTSGTHLTDTPDREQSGQSEAGQGTGQAEQIAEEV